MIEEKHITIKKTARYYTSGNLNENTVQLWYLLHGYGQLAREFLNEFKSYLNENRLFVAPEALNKFYFRGFSGKMGASWMTKEDRDNEIIDYINFLNSIYDEYNSSFNSKPELNLLAFSQGCHTAIRWLNKSKLPFSKIVLWAGTFPDDITMDNDYWIGREIINVYGNDDKLVNREKLFKQINSLKKNKVNVRLIEHDGKHKLYQNILQQIFND